MLFVGFLSLLTMAVCLGKSAKSSSDVEPIVNGQDAGQSKWPWKVLLMYKCGGSLLSERKVMTAEHCEEWEPENPSNFSMVLEVYDLSDEGEQELNVSEILMNPDNDSLMIGSDIDILFLQRLVPLNDSVQVVHAVYNESTDRKVSKALCYSTGWESWKQPGNTIPDSLQALKTKVISNRECNNLLEVNSYSYTSKMIGTVNTMSGVCFGDGSRGGPKGCRFESYLWSSWGQLPWCVLGHDTLFQLPSH